MHAVDVSDEMVVEAVVVGVAGELPDGDIARVAEGTLNKHMETIIDARKERMVLAIL